MGQTVVEHIDVDPAICGGRARILGTRIRVQDIYAWHELEGVSPDEIVTRFAQLSLADVYASLAYYWDHREEIQRQILEDRELIATMRSDIPSKLVPGSSAGTDTDASVPP
ncbi:MAG: DUF433 domain-containing protein [Isosphaeraceae bacterium]